MMENDIKRINTITVEGESMDGEKIIANYKILSLHEWSQEFEFDGTLPVVNLRFCAHDAIVIKAPLEEEKVEVIEEVKEEEKEETFELPVITW